MLDLLGQSLSIIRDYNLVSVFIGGGSPSKMDPQWFTALSRKLSESQAHIDLSKIEFTVEANPADITDDFIETALKAGVNRLSLGIQSADDKFLKIMGRRYDRAYLAHVLPKVRKAFGNLSYDFIYGVDGGERSVKNELEFLFGLAEPDHFSSYCYSKPDRPSTPMLCHEDASIKQEKEARRFLRSAGFSQYEVSNYAKAGRKCRHSLIYWSWETYLGIGAGAHSFFPIEAERFSYEDDIARFISSPAPLRAKLTEDELIKDFLMLTLRKNEGFALERFHRLFERNVTEIIGEAVIRLSAERRMRFTKTLIAPTVKGMDTLSDVTAILFKAVDDYFEKNDRRY